MKSLGDLTDAQLIAYSKGDLSSFTDSELTALARIESGSPQDPQAPSAEWMQGLKERDYLQQAPMTARAIKAAEGLPFVGGWIQDAAGMVSPELEQKVEAVSQAKQSQDPAESMALQLGGALASSAAFAPVAVPAKFASWVSSLPTFQKIITMGGSGASYGLLEGAVSGAGRGGEDNRVGGAAEGGLLGGVGGAFGGILPPALIKGYENLRKSFRNYGPEVISKQLGISVEAAQVIGNTFRDAGGDVKAALQNIFNAGEEGMLADSGIAAQALLDAAQATGGKASQIATEEVSGRVSRQGAQLSNTMDQRLGKLPEYDGVTGGAADLGEGIASASRASRQAAYKEAFDTPIDYSSGVGRSVENIFNAIPERFKAKAIERANDNMSLDAIASGQPVPKQIMVDIAEDGSISFSEMPNLRQLDQIKQAIGKVAFSEVDSLGRPTADALDAVQWYRQISQSLKEASPKYAEAVSLGGDKISLDNSLELGLSMLKPKLTPRDVSISLKGVGPEEIRYAKLGIRSAINDSIGNAKATIASPDIDINALRKVFSDLSSKNSRDKIRLVMGSKEADRLFKDLDRAQMSLALRAATAINSKTFTRQVVEGQVDELTDIGAIAHLLRLEPAQATQKLTQKITGETDELSVKMKQQIFTDIAKALTQIKGKAARKALKDIVRASRGQQVSDEELEAVSDILLKNSGFATIATGSEAAQSFANQE